MFTEDELKQAPVIYRFMEQVPLAAMKELETPALGRCGRLQSRAYRVTPDYKPLSNILLKKP